MKGGDSQKDVGVGPHPHRGFSPVTFVFEGAVEHRDSLGNRATVTKGGTQWMHAGKGITHSERPSKAIAEKGGLQEFIQFWVNTPASYKMEAPYYIPISDEDTPKVHKGAVEIGVVAGAFENKNGPAKTYSNQMLLRGETHADDNITITIPENYNMLIYILNGSITTEGVEAKTKDLIWYNNDSDMVNLQLIKGTRFIVLSGEPINENLSSYGPFVMNTQTEILQALKDAQMGKMGVLIEDFD
jgi:redox-sensitive bicupin YhaK (pirin superfamily)